MAAGDKGTVKHSFVSPYVSLLCSYSKMKGLRNAGGFWRISSEHMSRTGLSHMDKKRGMRSRGGFEMLSIFNELLLSCITQ